MFSLRRFVPDLAKHSAKNVKPATSAKTLSSLVQKSPVNGFHQHLDALLKPSCIEVKIVRNKYDKGKSAKHNDDGDSGRYYEDDDISSDLDKNSKVIKVHVNSLRVDLIVKSGLGIARK